MPAGVSGREARAAFAKFGTNSWNVAASVTRGIYFTTDGGLKLEPARVNDETFGQAFLGRGDLGDVAAPDLELTGRSRFDDWQYILDACAMGSPSVSLSNSATGQTVSWSHVIDVATTINGLGATFAFDKSRYIDELTSGKIYGFSEVVGDGGVMDKTYKVMGSKATNISSVNINSTVAGAVYPPLNNRVFRNQGVFRMNVQGGSGLAAGDTVAAETIEFSMERPQDAPNIFGSAYVAEPADNGFPMIQVKVTYPRMIATSAESLYSALRDNTVYKADLTFTGTNINSVDAYLRKYQFPALELDEWNGAPLDGATQVKPTATFTAKLAISSPTGMAFVNPVRLTLTNTSSIVAF